MKQLKKLFLFVVLLIAAGNVYSQDLISTVNGKFYWVNEKSGMIEKLDEVGVEDGRRIFRIPVSDIVSIEYIEQGLKILKPDKLQEVEPVAFDDNFDTFLAKGKKVYIPLASGIIQQRWGAKRLIELVLKEDYWKLARCEEEADFIMEYVFDDSGSDHAYLMFSDRTGKKVLLTGSVSASDFVPVHAGEESAEKLNKSILVEGAYSGKLSKAVQKQKKVTKKNHGCLYFLSY